MIIIIISTTRQFLLPEISIMDGTFHSYIICVVVSIIHNFASHTVKKIWPLSMNQTMRKRIWDIQWHFAAYRVSWKSAVIAGAVTTILLTAGRWVFSTFLSIFTTYQDLYGSLSVVPMFLIWLYISWGIILFGALFGHAFSLRKRGWFFLKGAVFLCDACYTDCKMYEVVV